VNIAAKLGAYAVSLALVFGAAVVTGAAVGPIGETSGSGHEAVSDGAMPTAAGLEVSSGGYTLAPAATRYDPGDDVEFAFRIEGPDGMPVTRYDELHDKELHLIVVRRDLSGFQHVHPTRDISGTWSVPLDLSIPGTYRVLADFKPTGSDSAPNDAMPDAAMSVVLGADVFVPGLQTDAGLPEPAATASVDGYDVALRGALVAGEESTVTLTVSKDGKPVADLQPYLAAYGHLVALRSGDLAYLHVHPDGEPGGGRTDAGPGITFHAQVPSVGTYRLYLDFRHRNRVRTAEFTVEASATRAAPATGDHGEGGRDHMEDGS